MQHSLCYYSFHPNGHCHLPRTGRASGHAPSLSWSVLVWGEPLPSLPQSLEDSGLVCLGDPVSNGFSGHWHSCLLPQGLSSHKPVGETFTPLLMAFSVNLTAKYFTGVFPPLFLIIARKKAELSWLPLWPLWFYV